MSKTYTLKLRGDRAVDAVLKIGDGQNTSEGILDQADHYYHLGSDKWYEMAKNRLLVLNGKDIDFAIGVLDNLGDAAMDNVAGNSYDGAEYRAKAKAYYRLRRALLKVWAEAHR